MNRKMYHIYKNNKVVKHSLTEESFREVWENLLKNNLCDDYEECDIVPDMIHSSSF
jgi:hypothetical protein